MANERRIVELVLKAVGDEQLKAMARDMQAVRAEAEKTSQQLEFLNKSFLGVSAAAAGAFIGNKIQEGLQLLISTVGDAVEEMNELAESGKAAGSGLSEAAVGGAVELSNAMEKLSAQISNATNEFVGGLAPALTLIVKQFSEAIGGMDGFREAGSAVGAMLADQVGQFNKAVATLGAYAQAAQFAAQTVTHAYKAWEAALSGNLDLSDKWMASAQAAAKATAAFATSAQQIGQAAYNATQAAYRGEVAAAARTGYGTPTATETKGGSKGGGGSSRSAAIKQEKEELSQYEKTMQMVNVQIVEMANAWQKADEERKKALERIPGQSNDQWEAEMEAQTAALEKQKEQWGFLGDAAGQATYDIITGTESVGRAMKRMAASIIADMVRLGAQKLLMKLLGVGDFGDVGTSIWGKIFGSASGNAFGSSGIISTPTLHGARGGGIGIAGEAGPEAILPLQRNSAGQLGVAASGAANVTVNNYASADVAVRQTDQGLQFDIFERRLANNIRNGGSPLSGAIENTYRSPRSANAY